MRGNTEENVRGYADITQQRTDALQQVKPALIVIQEKGHVAIQSTHYTPST